MNTQKLESTAEDGIPRTNLLLFFLKNLNEET